MSDSAAVDRVMSIMKAKTVMVTQIGQRLAHGAATLARSGGAAVLVATLSMSGQAMADEYARISAPTGGLVTKAPPASGANGDRQEAKLRVQRAYDSVVEEATGKLKQKPPVYFLWGKGKLTGHVVGVNQLFVAVTPARVTGESAIYVHPMSHIAKRVRISSGDAVVMYVDDESRSELYRGLVEPTLVDRLKNQAGNAADVVAASESGKVDQLVMEWKREREAVAGQPHEESAVSNTSKPRAF